VDDPPHPVARVAGVPTSLLGAAGTTLTAAAGWLLRRPVDPTFVVDLTDGVDQRWPSTQAGSQTWPSVTLEFDSDGARFYSIWPVPPGPNEPTGR